MLDVTSPGASLTARWLHYSPAMSILIHVFQLHAVDLQTRSDVYNLCNSVTAG